MRCEVCGHKIYGKSYRVTIEGAKLTVCGKCTKHGRIIWEEKKSKPVAARTKAPPRRLPFNTKRKKQLQPAAENSLELTEDFDVKIRQARRKLGLSHEDLGRKIREKVSVLKKIETRKMIPNNKLATKLEHTLNIKLLVQASKEAVETKIPKAATHELTLGDLIQLEKGKVEEKMQRKQS